MKSSTILTGLGVSAVAIGFPIAYNSNEAGPSRIKSAIASVGFEVSAADIKFQRTSGSGSNKKDSYVVALPYGETAVANYYPSSGFFSVNSDVDYLRSKQPFKDRARKWQSESSLRAAVGQMFKSLTNDHPGRLAECSMTDDSGRNGLSPGTTPGVIRARFQLTFQGFVQIDGFRGFEVNLATRDGAIIRVSGGLNGSPRAAFRDEISQSEAKSRLQAHAPGLDPNLLNSYYVVKGWAIPSDSDGAVISYRFQRQDSYKSDPTAVYVESKKNGRVWRNQ